MVVHYDPDLIRRYDDVRAEDEWQRAHWRMFLNWELEYCRSEGAIDSGAHILAVVQRNHPAQVTSA